MNIKLIKDWKRILIDTSIICHLFVSENPKSEDITAKFIRRLIDYLNNYGTGNKEDRVFCVTTVTISELLTKETDVEKIKRVLQVLNSNNVEFLDFDLESSLNLNSQIYPYLSTDELNKRAKEFGFKTNEFMMAREWISKDLMILCTGLVNSIDVCLTVDKKTMYPICKEINLPCVLAYPELFDSDNKIILRYNKNLVPDFLANKKVNLAKETAK